jgi:hypothetical protein
VVGRSFFFSLEHLSLHFYLIIILCGRYGGFGVWGFWGFGVAIWWRWWVEMGGFWWEGMVIKGKPKRAVVLGLDHCFGVLP